MEALTSSIISGTFCARMFSSNVANKLASATLQAGKTASKDIEMKAVDVDKTVATDAGKMSVEDAAKEIIHTQIISG